ncbi:ATP-binding cassette domain-containing protein, partial [Bacillus cereus group sp. BC326]
LPPPPARYPRHHHPSVATLDVRDLRKAYGDQEVVAGLSFAVDAGTCFGLLGPNGAGKTTTLRLCLGLTAPAGGSIALNGYPIPAQA